MRTSINRVKYREAKRDFEGLVILEYKKISVRKSLNFKCFEIQQILHLSN